MTDFEALKWIPFFSIYKSTATVEQPFKLHLAVNFDILPQASYFQIERVVCVASLVDTGTSFEGPLNLTSWHSLTLTSKLQNVNSPGWYQNGVDVVHPAKLYFADGQTDFKHLIFKVLDPSSIQIHFDWHYPGNPPAVAMITPVLQFSFQMMGRYTSDVGI